MLIITIPKEELYNEQTEEFITVPEVVVCLEHSLISLSKWESKFEKPFLSKGEKSNEQIMEYIACMIISPEVNSEILLRLTSGNLDEIQTYIDSKQSATTFGRMPERKGREETITSELIYYWMVAFNIPFECQYWHLNRLFALIKIYNLKNSKQPKMSRRELAERNRELNEQRKAQHGTRG